VQGEAGIVVPKDGYLARCAEICRRHRVLMICDEVQTGLGRTGYAFGWQHDGAKPDGVILGKALGGGLLPVSAFVATDDVMQVFHPGDHGSTFGGGPLVASAANVVLERVSDPAFLHQVEVVGAALRDGLAALRSPQIVEVRGRGLMIGVELTVPAADVVAAGYAHGLIMISAGPNVLRLVPPLILEQMHVDEALEKLGAILGE